MRGEKKKENEINDGGRLPVDIGRNGAQGEGMKENEGREKKKQEMNGEVEEAKSRLAMGKR